MKAACFRSKTIFETQNPTELCMFLVTNERYERLLLLKLCYCSSFLCHFVLKCLNPFRVAMLLYAPKRYCCELDKWFNRILIVVAVVRCRWWCWCLRILIQNLIGLTTYSIWLSSSSIAYLNSN